jgi:carbon storage regulator
MSENNKTKTNSGESKGLILTRKKGEKFTIGKSVQIEIIGYERGYVKLSIKAPKNIPVYRQEILDEIVEQNLQSIKQNVSIVKQALTDIKIAPSK